MLEHNIHEHVKHSKRFKKPMIQGALKQTLDNVKTRSYPLRIIAEKDSTHKERKANCTHQCKECSNQFKLKIPLNNQKTVRTTNGAAKPPPS